MHRSPIKKDGRNLGVSVECINGLKKSHIRAVNLANNHILDHGEQGLKSTVEALNSADIEWFGAGSCLVEAQKPLVKTINNSLFVFIGVAEHEFSIAGNNTWGANPIDIINNLKVIRKYRNEADFLIVLLHGGKEHYPYPTPNLQKTCRFLIDEGTDVVICQHSHCAGSYEIYKTKPIIYGQGNLIFERPGKKIASQFEGVLLSLEFSNIGIDVKFIPYIQSKDIIGARKMSEDDERNFILALNNRSLNILSSEFVEKEWLELCRNEKYLYESRVRGHNRWLRFLNRKLHFTDWLCSEESHMQIRNVVECEVHREGLETLWRYNI